LNSNKYIKQNKTLNSIISSTTGGVIAVILISPFNYVKTRQILYKSQKGENIINSTRYMRYILKDIYNEKKTIFGFWKALNPSLMTSFYSSIQITLYQILKNKFLKQGEENFKLNSLFGLISRCVACTIIFPFSLMRSRMLNFQADNLIKNLNKDLIFYCSDYKYRNVFEDLKIIIKREGIRSLFRGLNFELIKVSINGALFFYAYEYLIKYL
jgi:hypothetical protein